MEIGNLKEDEIDEEFFKEHTEKFLILEVICFHYSLIVKNLILKDY